MIMYPKHPRNASMENALRLMESCTQSARARSSGRSSYGYRLSVLLWGIVFCRQCNSPGKEVVLGNWRLIHNAFLQLRVLLVIILMGYHMLKHQDALARTAGPGNSPRSLAKTGESEKDSSDIVCGRSSRASRQALKG